MPTTADPEIRPRVLRVRQVQQMTGLSRAHIYNLIERGALKRCELKDDARTVLIPIESVYEYLGLVASDPGVAS